MILVLDNIRSAHNVGSLFRTADAVGVTRVVLCGVTPAPVDRFLRKRADVAKIALGAEDSIPWEHTFSTEEAIRKLKKEGRYIVALEQNPNSVPYTKVAKSIDISNTAVVLGEETKGLPEEILSLADIIAEIPMSGTKESLNVAVSAGVALFCFRDYL